MHADGWTRTAAAALAAVSASAAAPGRVGVGFPGGVLCCPIVQRGQGQAGAARRAATPRDCPGRVERRRTPAAAIDVTDAASDDKPQA